LAIYKLGIMLADAVVER